MIIETKNLKSVWDRTPKHKREEISRDDFAGKTQLVLSSYYHYNGGLFYCLNLYKELANYSIDRIRVTEPPKEGYDQVFKKIEVYVEGEWKIHQSLRQV